MTHPLDDIVRAALTGPQASFALSRGRVVRYPADVSPFVSLPAAPTAGDWADLAALLAPGQIAALTGAGGLLDSLPADWEAGFDAEGVQMVATDSYKGEAAPDALTLGPVDVPEALDLVERTRPGPFFPGTYRLGTYLGVRRSGRLVAMAGERMHVPGYVEISAVCTDPAFRGQGLAGRLIDALVHDIRLRGETPVLHAVSSNESALRLYRKLGFEERRRVWFYGVTKRDEAA